MIAGIFLSVLGGIGTYYFGEQKTRLAEKQASRTSPTIEVAEPDLPVRGDDAEDPLASIIEPVEQPAPMPPEPPPAPEPELPPANPKPPPDPPHPIVEKMAAAAEVASAPPPEIAIKPEPPVPAPPIPKSEPPVQTPLPGHDGLGIAPWQSEKLLQRLRAFKHGTITIQAPESSDEARRFAAALKEAFVTAGWRVVGVDSVKAARNLKGITLSSGTFPPPTEVTTVFGALVTAGIKVSTDLDPSLGKGHAVLFVGSRP